MNTGNQKITKVMSKKLVAYGMRPTTRSLILAGMIFSILIPSVFINIFYLRWLKNDQMEQLDNYNKSVVEQAGEKINTLLNQVNNVKRQLIASTISSDNIKPYAEMKADERINVYKRFTKTLQDIDMSLMLKASIFMIGEGISVQSSSDMVYINDAHEDIKSAIPGVPFLADHFTSKHETRIIPFVTEIKNYSYNLIQWIVIELEYNELERVLADAYLGRENELFIINDAGYLVYYDGIENEKMHEFVGKRVSANSEGEYTHLSNFSKYVVKLDYPGWDLIAYTSDKNAIGGSSKIIPSFTMILIGSVTFAVFYSLYVSRSITKPIQELKEKMSHFNDDAIAKTPIDTENQDIKALAVAFDSMRNSILVLEEKNSAKERENIMAKLKALQAQINPHFLYNTLEVMRSIAVENKVWSIEEISRYLAKMFRYSISGEDSFVTVKDEVDHIKNYVSIQKYRFGDRLQVFYYIDKEILSQRMVKFILQPIVENAILHGLETIDTNGVVTIIGRREKSILEFRIIDNGIGMNKEKLEELKKTLEEHSDTTSGIGVVNVNERLKLFYGTGYGLTIDSREKEGTQVTIRIKVE